jgi:hypothetical protein
VADNPADAITDNLITRSRDGFNGLAAELEQRWREMVSVPVQGHGRSAIRSRPGEPPRLEFGDYQDSVSHTSSVEGDIIHATAGTNMTRGIWLEKGTSRMKPRPHASKLAEEFGGEVVTRVAEVFADATK